MVLGKHARRALLGPRGPRRRRPLGRLEERDGHRAARLVAPVPAGPQAGIVGDEPHEAQDQRRGQPAERQAVDLPECRLGVDTPQEKEEHDDSASLQRESEEIGERDQAVVGTITESSDVEPERPRRDDDQRGAQRDLREQQRRARTHGQARPDPDQQDAQGEKRRLALE